MTEEYKVHVFAAEIGGSPRRDRGAAIAGAILLGLGVLLLLEHFDLLGRLAISLIPVAMFLTGAVLFLRAYRRAPESRWGLLIPTGVFLSLAAMIGAEALRFPGTFQPLIFFAGLAIAFSVIWLRHPRHTWAVFPAAASALIGITAFVSTFGRFGDALAPMIMMGGIGLAFAWYFLRTEKDWALLPAGFFATIGLVAMVDELRLPERLQTSVFFFGLAATFAIYYLLGSPRRVRWATIPAIALAAMGVFALFARSFLSFGVPLLLIGFGLFLILRPTERPLPPSAAPSPPPTEPADEPIEVNDGNDAHP